LRRRAFHASALSPHARSLACAAFLRCLGWQVLDAPLGSVLSCAAGQSDPIGRCHAAVDGVVGAMAAALRMLQPAPQPSAPAPDAASASSLLSSSSSSSSPPPPVPARAPLGSGAGDDGPGMASVVVEHLRALKRCREELPDQVTSCWGAVWSGRVGGAPKPSSSVEPMPCLPGTLPYHLRTCPGSWRASPSSRGSWRPRRPSSPTPCRARRWEHSRRRRMGGGAHVGCACLAHAVGRWMAAGGHT